MNCTCLTNGSAILVRDPWCEDHGDDVTLEDAMQRMNELRDRMVDLGRE